MESPYIVQPKLDGERCRAIIAADGDIKLLSSEEHEIVSVPHIVDALSKTGLKGVELDGELYIHGMPFESIHSIVSRTVNRSEFSQEMQYHIFDVVSGNSQIERVTFLDSIKEVIKRDPLQMVRIDSADTFDEIMALYDKYIQAGYEGFIIRHILAPYRRSRSTFMMKFKPKKSDFYTITGTVEEVSIQGEPKNSLGALIVSDGDKNFNVGTGLTREQRIDLWKTRDTLPGKMVEVKYQHLTENHIPRFPVFVSIVEPGQEPEHWHPEINLPEV